MLPAPSEDDLALRRLIEHLPGIVFQYRRTADGRPSLPFVSEGARRLHGIAPEALRTGARRLLRHVHRDDCRQLGASLAASAAQLAPWRLDFRVAGPDGGFRWFEGRTGTPEREADGSTVWHGLLVDIDERRRGERARVEAQAAQRADEAQARLISRLSHELRTPLNAVLGFAELLRLDAAHPLTAAQRIRIDHIENAGAALLAVVDGLLDPAGSAAGSAAGQAP